MNLLVFGGGSDVGDIELVSLEILIVQSFLDLSIFGSQQLIARGFEVAYDVVIFGEKGLHFMSSRACKDDMLLTCVVTIIHYICQSGRGKTLRVRWQ